MKIILTETQFKHLSLIKENEEIENEEVAKKIANKLKTKMSAISSELNKVYSLITLESVSDILLEPSSMGKISDIIKNLSNLDREISEINSNINSSFANAEFEHFMFELYGLNEKNRLKCDVLEKIVEPLKQISEINSELGYDVSIDEIFTDIQIQTTT